MSYFIRQNCYLCSLISDFVEKEATDVDEDSFFVINSDMASQNCVYLFARADREKEEW